MGTLAQSSRSACLISTHTRVPAAAKLDGSLDKVIDRYRDAHPDVLPRSGVSRSDMDYQTTASANAAQTLKNPM